MIKLIVTDMDNTLVHNDKTLPKEIFPLIERLYEKGIRFAVASARHFHNLNLSFGPVSDKIGTICDNGAYGEIDHKVFVREAMKPEKIKEIVDFCETIPGVIPMLCGRDAMYYQKPAPFMKQTKEEASTDSLFRLIQVGNLKDVDSEVFRFALYDPINPLRHSLPLLSARFGGEMHVVATDDESVDLMNPGINKGTGLQKLQEYLGISPKETMAFGDYYNDIEMLDQAEYSFAVANALEEVKRHCNYLTESNQENGVLLAIERYLENIPLQKKQS